MSTLIVRPILESYLTYGVEQSVLSKSFIYDKNGLPPCQLIIPITSNNLGYAHGIQIAWGSSADNLIVWEQDVYPTNLHYEKMLSCPYPLCTGTYFTQPSHTGIDRPIIPIRDRDGIFVDPDELPDFADMAPLGFVRFKKIARKECPNIPITHWKKLDTAISQVFIELGMKFHVHPQIIEHRQI